MQHRAATWCTRPRASEPWRILVSDTSKRVTISLSRQEYESIAGYAKSRERSISWTVRYAVKEFIRQHKEPLQEKLPFVDEG
jgi:hypothetical protein